MSGNRRGFWHWLIIGDRSSSRSHEVASKSPGIYKLFNVWSIIYICIAIYITNTFVIELKVLAASMLLPAAGLFIGVAFAWGGNAHAILQTKEIEELAQYKDGGFEDYAYTFQLSMLIVLLTITLWTLAGIGIFENLPSPYIQYVTIFILSLSAIAIRECWHIIVGSTELLIMKYYVRIHKKK